MAHRPVSLVSIRQLRKIERRRLLDELYITRARNLVVETKQHRIRQIHAAQRNLKHTTRAQYLRLQPMCRPTKHHHRTRKLADERLTRQQVADMPRDEDLGLFLVLRRRGVSTGSTYGIARWSTFLRSRSCFRFSLK